MAPPLLGENARQKFTGNVTFYQYQYLHRQRVFLPRNVNAVVAANEASRGKKLKLEPLSRDASAAPGAAARYSSNRSRPRRSINQIFAYLQPSGYSSQGGGEEPRLKIEVKSLRLLSNETPRTSMSYGNRTFTDFLF